MAPALLNPGAEVPGSARAGAELIKHKIPAHRELPGAPAFPHSSFFIHFGLLLLLILCYLVN